MVKTDRLRKTLSQGCKHHTNYISDWAPGPCVESWTPLSQLTLPRFLIPNLLKQDLWRGGRAWLNDFWLNCLISLRKMNLVNQNILLVKMSHSLQMLFFLFMTSGIIPFAQWSTCQFREALPQVHLKGDSMEPRPKVTNNICSLGPHQKRVTGKSRNSLARILASSVHFSAALIKENLRLTSSPHFLRIYRVSGLVLSTCPNASCVVPTIHTSHILY